MYKIDYKMYEIEKTDHQNEYCMIEEFFREQEKIPVGMRSNSCLICCPCSKCRGTYTL